MPNPGKWSDHIGDRELTNDAVLTQRYAVMHCVQSLLDCGEAHLSAHLQNILADEFSLCHDFAAQIHSHSWYPAGNTEPKGHLHIEDLQEN